MALQPASVSSSFPGTLTHADSQADIHRNTMDKAHPPGAPVPGLMSFHHVTLQTKGHVTGSLTCPASVTARQCRAPTATCTIFFPLSPSTTCGFRTCTSEPWPSLKQSPFPLQGGQERAFLIHDYGAGNAPQETTHCHSTRGSSMITSYTIPKVFEITVIIILF